MKYFLLFFFMPICAFAQYLDYGVYKASFSKPDCGYYQFIGSEWVVISTEVKGSDSCAHFFVYGEEYYPNANTSCAVFHNGAHCDWGDPLRKKICKNCGCLVIEWFRYNECYVECPGKQKSEFDVLVDSFTKRR